jgi:hypothetical protein
LRRSSLDIFVGPAKEVAKKMQCNA